MGDTDIRWKQRFANYRKAYARLKDAAAFFAEKSGEDAKANVAMEALIKCFEFTFELAWQTMKDIVSYKGYVTDIHGSRDSIRAAVQFNLIDNGQTWMDMVDDRNRAVHAYNEITARDLANRIFEQYRPEFAAFEEKMNTQA
jgi:nucleotidyltransferase substrate binding protein (TIGR01987 family)